MDVSRVLGYGSGGTVVYQGTFEGRKVAVKRMLNHYYDLAQLEIRMLIESDEHPSLIRYLHFSSPRVCFNDWFCYCLCFFFLASSLDTLRAFRMTRLSIWRFLIAHVPCTI